MLDSFFLSFVLAAVVTIANAHVVPKVVVAHFIVGNAYPYTQSDWEKDISLAASKGIDGFVLNVGNDDWEPARVADAYEAARVSTTPFKMLLSFDMASLPCDDQTDGELLRRYVSTYYNHESQLMVTDKPVMTTFGGQNCYFGESSVDDGWRSVLKTGLPEIYFIPSFFIDPAMYGSIGSADGAFSWDSAWPMGNYDINSEYDVEHRKYLDGRTYMAGVSPWFFTHYGSDSYNKNFIFRADNWLLAERWEILVRDRELVDMVEVISWNDYGESHYIGPISGAQPNSQSWTTGFDHQGWLDLQAYYIAAYKTGSYPPITRDRIFLWGRLYPARADSPDPLPRPLNYQFTEDFVWSVVLLTLPAQLRLACGNSSVLTTDLPEGVSKVRLSLVADCSPTAILSRNGRGTMTFAPADYRFSTNLPMYNFNAFVAASP